MASKLVALAGPLRGGVFSLVAAETAIGRDTTNTIAIGDARASRTHAVLKRADDATVTLVDLGSLNGTFVNGVPIGERPLVHGDRIEIGSSTFLFLRQDEEASPSGAVSLGRLSGSGATVELSGERLRALTPEGLASATPPALTRVLAQLLAATRALHSARSVAAWTEALFPCVFEALPAERVAILLEDAGGTSAASSARARGAAGECVMAVDGDLTRRVLEEGVALLGSVQSTVETGGPAGAASPAGERSVVAAPLLAAGRTAGVLYADAARPFAEADLEIAAALAAVAAGALANVRHVEWLAEERGRLAREIHLEHEMVGESPALRRVQEVLTRVARSDTTVLLLGESGTGKELVARALHWHSPRAERPFVAINCAALPETLLESELFGHERGAFTGAVTRQIGKFEAAHGGTLFLDEIGEMPLGPAGQAAAGPRGRARSSGSAAAARLKVDVRVIAATNRDLEAAVEDGTFREDLYYRLNVVALRLPPLRERREDIPLLASYFAARAAQKVKRPLVAITPEARACLQRYDWPGNVRELHNAIERAVVLGSGELLQPEDLPEHVLDVPAPATDDAGGAYHAALHATKIRLIRQAVERADGSIVQAAALLGLHPNYLHRLMRNLGLKGVDPR